MLTYAHETRHEKFTSFLQINLSSRSKQRRRICTGSLQLVSSASKEDHCMFFHQYAGVQIRSRVLKDQIQPIKALWEICSLCFHKIKTFLSMTNDTKTDNETKKELADTSDRNWADLQTELLCLILPRLFISDIKRFHSVCRSWNSTPTTSIQSPVLMCIGSDNIRCKIFHPLHKDPYSMFIPELFGAVLRFSKDGWLLMSRGEYSIFFFNPFTKALINLSDLPNPYNFRGMTPHNFRGMTFTSSPTLPDCMVFGIHCNYDDFFSIATICRGKESWSVCHGRNNSPIYLSHCNPVYHDGKFYCLGQNKNLGVFSPWEDSWIVFDNPHRSPNRFNPFISREQSFLVECDDELLSVSMSFMGELICVSKLDNVLMTWHRVDNLGQEMLFVSNTASLSAKRVVQGMENKIYLPRINKKCGVFFSLSNGLMQTFGNNFSQKNLYGTGELLHCCWIEPRAETYSSEELNWFADHES